MYRNERYEYPGAGHKTVGYPYRVWICTILLTPLLITFNSPTDPFLGYLFNYFVWLSILLLLSIPAGVIYILMFWRLAGSKLTNIQTKILLAITGIAALYIETIFAQLIFSKVILLSTLIDIHFIIFSITFLISSLFFSLKEK